MHSRAEINRDTFFGLVSRCCDVIFFYTVHEYAIFLVDLFVLKSALANNISEGDVNLLGKVKKILD